MDTPYLRSIDLLYWILRSIISIDNQRSFIYIANIIDEIVTCLDNPNAHNQTFLLSDGENLSTPALIRHLAHYLNTPALLLPIPQPCSNSSANSPVNRVRLPPVGSANERLLGSLIVSNEKIVTTLNWQPPSTVEQGLEATAKSYLNQKKRTTD